MSLTHLVLDQHVDLVDRQVQRLRELFPEGHFAQV